jgi:hypothetical protein
VPLTQTAAYQYLMRGSRVHRVGGAPGPEPAFRRAEGGPPRGKALNRSASGSRRSSRFRASRWNRGFPAKDREADGTSRKTPLRNRHRSGRSSIRRAGAWSLQKESRWAAGHRRRPSACRPRRSRSPWRRARGDKSRRAPRAGACVGPSPHCLHLWRRGVKAPADAVPTPGAARPAFRCRESGSLFRAFVRRRAFPVDPNPAMDQPIPPSAREVMFSSAAFSR